MKKYIYHKGLEIEVIASKPQDFSELEVTEIEVLPEDTLIEIEAKFYELKGE